MPYNVVTTLSLVLPYSWELALFRLWKDKNLLTLHSLSGMKQFRYGATAGSMLVESAFYINKGTSPGPHLLLYQYPSSHFMNNMAASFRWVWCICHWVNGSLCFKYLQFPCKRRFKYNIVNIMCLIDDICLKISKSPRIDYFLSSLRLQVRHLSFYQGVPVPNVQ